MSKILLVEDNEINQELMTRRLKNRGYEVRLAEDGEKALALLKNEKFDLVLIDISLPKMSGLQVVEICKSDHKLSHIIFVALTAHAMESTKEEALGIGCQAFVTKPVDYKLLMETIEPLLIKKT